MKQTFKKLLAVIIAITMILGLTPSTSNEVEAAQKFNCSVINLVTPRLDMDIIKSNLNTFVKKTQGDSCSANTTIKNLSTSYNNFVETWNSLPETQYVVVIGTHGTPTTLKGYYGNTILTTSDVNNLKWKNISYIVLLGCNNGHYDHRANNLARTFADRFKCTVIASDGTVKLSSIIHITNPKTQFDYFTPVADAEWEKYNKSKRAGCYGWLAYVPKTVSNHYEGKLYQLSDCLHGGSVYQLLYNYSFGPKVSLR